MLLRENMKCVLYVLLSREHGASLPCHKNIAYLISTFGSKNSTTERDVIRQGELMTNVQTPFMHLEGSYYSEDFVDRPAI